MNSLINSDILKIIRSNKSLLALSMLFLAFSLFYMIFPAQYNFLLGLYMNSLVKTVSFLLSSFHLQYVFNWSSYSFVLGSFNYTIDTQYASLTIIFFVLASFALLTNYSTLHKIGVYDKIPFLIK